MRYKLFFKNAAILTVTSLLLRTVGIFFRVWLSGKVGSEGMGLYQLILSVYTFASTFTISGICTAVTRLITDALANQNGKDVGRVMRRAIMLTMLLAAASMGIIYFGADFIAQYILKDYRCALSIKILSFSLPFMGICSCLRGYFMARRKAVFPSVGQLIEQFLRIAFLMATISAAASKGLEFTCAAVITADAVAETVSCGYLYIAYRLDKRKVRSQKNAPKLIKVVRKILHIATPISGGKYLSSGLRTVENIMVPTYLTKYNSSRELSLSQFGALRGMAIPILFFPSSFLNAVSTLLIPEISEALSKGHRYKLRTVTSKSIYITAISSILIGGIFFVVGPEVGRIFYKTDETGYIIRALAPIVPFMYLESVADGILKGLDQQLHSFWYEISDSVGRIFLIWMILPSSGMAGFLGIMVISNLLTSTLNLRRLLKVTDLKTDYGKWVIKPLISVLIAGICGYVATKNLSGDWIVTITCVLVMTFVFLSVLYVLKGIEREDLSLN